MSSEATPSKSRPEATHGMHAPAVWTRRAFLLGAGAAATGVGLYSAFYARHELEISHTTIAIRELPDAFVGFKIAQITDIHLEEYTEPSFLEHVVDEANKQNVDVVLLTGDFVSRGPVTSVGARAAGVCAEILSKLKAPERYGILGNHDVGVGANNVIDPLEAHGTPVLVDSFYAFERGGDRLWLAGLDDAGTRRPDIDMALPPIQGKAPLILMGHEPDYADVVRRHPRVDDVDLMLSGHSHGGQVRLPGIGPMILPPLGKKYVAGHFQFNAMQLYVSRGIGTVGLPFRLNCPAELAIFTLQRA